MEKGRAAHIGGLSFFSNRGQVAAQNQLAIGWSMQVLVVEDDYNLRRFLTAIETPHQC
jgi:hypothetical protein